MGCSCNKGALNRQLLSKQGWLQGRLTNVCPGAAGRAFPLSQGVVRGRVGVADGLVRCSRRGTLYLAGAGGVRVVAAHSAEEFRETHNANPAAIFNALYVMYGLIVGFSAYFASYQYDPAQMNVEAGSVQELHRLAEGFPGRNGGGCRTCRSRTPGP